MLLAIVTHQVHCYHTIIPHRSRPNLRQARSHSKCAWMISFMFCSCVLAQFRMLQADIPFYVFRLSIGLRGSSCRFLWACGFLFWIPCLLVGSSLRLLRKIRLF